MAPLLSRRTAAAVILSVAALPAASAFQAAAAPPLRMRAGASAACAAVSMATDSPRSSVDRRELLGVALGGAAVLLGAAPVLAKDVGDGGLPEGMMLLQQVLMFQKQWKDIGVRVADHHEEMDKTEWANIQGFLRKFYEGGDDMVKIGKGFSSNEQTEVKELAKTFRKAVKDITSV
ncbi:hypothetical protein T484DRAFT_1811506 [Baffinella frigidus]|nr:hypothetical protein T484DRAFT_1811506 [Cryptophyta sp. CCMP2293]